MAIRHVRFFEDAHYRVLGLVWCGPKLLMTVSRVFDDAHSTQIWDALDGELLFTVPGAETLVTGVTRFRRGDWETYWAPEHAPGMCLRYRAGQFTWHGETKGKWAVSGVMWQRKNKPPFPMTGVNNVWPWGAKGFLDEPSIRNMQTGKKRYTIPAAGFPNTLLQHGGFNPNISLYAFLYFCDDPRNTGIWRPDGWKIRGDYGHGVSCNNGKHIICTGGKLRVQYREGYENGNIYRVQTAKKRVKALGNTGSKRGIHNAVGGNKVYCLMGEPFSLWQVKVRDWSTKMLWWDGINIPHPSNSFGGAIAIKLDENYHPERFHFAYSKGRTPRLMEVDL